MPISLIESNYTMLAAGGTKTFDVNEFVEIYNLIPNGGSITLLNNLTISPTGTPYNGMKFVFNYGGEVIISTFALQIFGYTLTAAEALSAYTIEATYINNSWVVKLNLSKTLGSADSINGGDIIDATIVGSDKLTNSSVTLAKMAPLAARGNIISGGAAGVAQDLIAKTSGQVLAGDGTDVRSLPLAGAITATYSANTLLTALASDSVTTAKILNSNVTTAKIADTNVTIVKVVTDLKTAVSHMDVSFEASEVGEIKIHMPFKGSLTFAYACVSRVLGATDAGTVAFRNNGGAAMTQTTPLSFPASSVVGAGATTNITANNTFVSGDVIFIATAKATAGGRVLLSLTFLKAD